MNIHVVTRDGRVFLSFERMIDGQSVAKELCAESVITFVKTDPEDVQAGRAKFDYDFMLAATKAGVSRADLTNAVLRNEEALQALMK